MCSIEILETPEKSEDDKKSYRVIQLLNGLKALLISDPTIEFNEDAESKSDPVGAKLAACALCVDVGLYTEPRDVPGLSHFLGNFCYLYSNKSAAKLSDFFFIYRACDCCRI